MWWSSSVVEMPPSTSGLAGTGTTSAATAHGETTVPWAPAAAQSLSSDQPLS